MSKAKTVSISLFKSAISLAEEWLEFSRKAHGWNCHAYKSDKAEVWCYFADNSQHRCVKFGKYNDELQIIFHSPVRFSDLTLNSLENISSILKESKLLLESERAAFEKRDKSEVERERQERIKQARFHLEQLEREEIA